uniref:MARVEL domain-containing protein n=1 Tax=Parascaris univalens TaxID=6257 RepID=A0A915ANL4_PARUN
MRPLALLSRISSYSMDGFDDVESNGPRRLISTSIFLLVVSLHFILAIFLLILLLVGHSVGFPSPSFITLLLLESLIAFVGLCALSYNSLRLRLAYILLNVLTSISAISWAFYLFIISNDHESYKAFILIFLFILQFGMAGVAAFLGHKPLPNFCRRSQILIMLSSLPSESQVQVIKRNADDRIHESKSSDAKEVRKVKNGRKISSKNSTRKTSPIAASETSLNNRSTRNHSSTGRKSRKMMREVDSNESVYGNAPQDASKQHLPADRTRSASDSTLNNATKHNTQGDGSTHSFLSLASSLSMIPTGIVRFISVSRMPFPSIIEHSHSPHH